MIPLVQKELERFVVEGIIEPFPFSDWAVSIVPVANQDKASVTICSDFKLTVN